MPRSRAELLNDLADYKLPIEPVLAELSEYGWDSIAPLFTVKRLHVLGVLSRYLDGQLTREQVTDWADLLECREDFDYEKGSEEQIKQAVFELANPNLTEPLSTKVADSIREKLSSQSLELRSLDVWIQHDSLSSGRWFKKTRTRSKTGLSAFFIIHHSAFILILKTGG